MRSSIVFGAALAVGCSFAVAAAAQAPPLIPMQGFVTDAADAPLTGEQTISFAIYDVDTGGTALFTESQSVMVDAGRFTAYIGDVAALDLAIFRDNPTLFVEITVGEETLSPRLQLASAPYAGYAEYAGTAANALNAANADTVGGRSATDLASPAWTSITGVPADIADGDADTDTTYSAGPGMSLSGTTFSVDSTYTQRRVSSTCPAGSSIRAINADGTVVCETDTDTDTNTTYSAGTGLALSGTTLSADTGYLQRRVSATCAAGSSIRAIAADGTVTCEVDDGGGTSGTSTEANLNVQSMGSVSSTTDEVILSRYMGDLGGVTTARVALVVNGEDGRGAPAGGTGTATIRCGGTTIATISLEGGGVRPWTHITSSFSLSSCASTLDVLVRASSSASPVILREVSVLWGH